MDTFRARDLMKMIADATWVCGDPGMQFDPTINDWHTCAGTSRINASNPCSEYMFLDDTACNLASLNLMRFRREDGSVVMLTFEVTAATPQSPVTASRISLSGTGGEPLAAMPPAPHFIAVTQ